MRKFLTAAVAALTIGGAITATATPVEARPHGYGGGYYGGYGGHYYGHRGGVGAGTAIAAGVAGLAVGAALASSNHGYNRGGYYDRGYYGGGYSGNGYGYGYYDDAYRVCESRHWVFDPYIGRRVLVTDRYAC